jgi:GNAT superfamily N-acetyltransferase
MMETRPLEPGDEGAVVRFLERIPEGDRTFFKEDVDDPEVRAAWVRPGTARVLALDGDDVVGYVAVVPLQGWSNHVGEVRVIVDPDHRGHGIGRALAQRAVLEALKLGLTKMVVEVVADQSGELRDLILLSHSVEQSWASLNAAGIADSV